MNQWDRFAAAEAREMVIRFQLTGDDLHSLPHALIRGWDYIGSLSEIDPPNGGVWRTPHIGPAKFFREPDDAPLGIFDRIKGPDDLCTRNWRLLRIYPDAADWRHEDDDGRPDVPASANDTGARDIFAAQDEGAIAHRDHFITSIFGHSLRDHSEFVFELLRDEPELGELVLQKRFKEAYALDPKVLDHPWPSSVVRRWKGKNFDYLPPFAHAALVGEFQRLAQNVCSHIAVSYFDSGAEATLASIAKECTRFQKKSNQARPAQFIYDDAVAAMIDMAPFQTLALQPSSSTLLSRNSALAVGNLTSVAGNLFKDIVTCGRELVDFISGHHSESPSPLLAKGLTHHLDRAPDRKAKNQSMAHRTDYAATYWGMNWLTHAYVGLAQLSLIAAIYNQRFRPDGPKIRQRADSDVGRMVGLHQSIARIPYFWLETTNRAAFDEASRKLAKSCIDNAMTKALRAHEIVAEAKADDAETTLIRRGLEERWEASSIFDDREATIKERDVKAAMKLARDKPRAGMPGYTAQYRVHSWFDYMHDDIGFWIGRAIASREGSFTVPIADVPTCSANDLRDLILGDIERYRDWSPDIAEKVNQDLAMTIGAFATDPQHSWFRRKGLWKWAFICGNPGPGIVHRVGHANDRSSVFSPITKGGRQASWAVPRRREI